MLTTQDLREAQANPSVRQAFLTQFNEQNPSPYRERIVYVSHPRLMYPRGYPYQLDLMGIFSFRTIKSLVPKTRQTLLFFPASFDRSKIQVIDDVSSAVLHHEDVHARELYELDPTLIDRPNRQEPIKRISLISRYAAEVRALYSQMQHFSDLSCSIPFMKEVCYYYNRHASELSSMQRNRAKKVQVPPERLLLQAPR